MTNDQLLSIDEITIILVDSMLHFIGVILTGQEKHNSQNERLNHDLRQLEAINQQLQMLLCTCPESPWARYSWSQNFNSFFTQATHLCRHCLGRISPPLSGISTGVIQELSSLIYRGKQCLKN